MSFIGSAFGQNGTGLNYKAQSANILDPATIAQANTAYGQTQDALAQQQALVNALQGQNGIQNQSNVFNQLQGVANGTGPNPAQAQLAQSTGANVANQAALMAGQRGASANSGLIARQAGMQGANTQQQAAGQAATLQAQQSLGALNQLGGIAGQQVGQQQQAVGNLNQFGQSEQQNILGAINNQNNAHVNMQSNINNANAGIAGIAAGGQEKMLAGAMNGIGGASGLFAAGGVIGPKSNAGKHLRGIPKLAEGGKVPALVSPGEVYLSPDKAKQVAQGKADPISAGEKIPGKPKHPGNNYANDTVPKKLDAGGVVIPNSVMQSKDPHGEAHKFVDAVMAKHSIKASSKKNKK